MEVWQVLQQMGGVATRAQLLRNCPRKAVDAAVAADQVVVLARGRYALAGVGEAEAAAHRLTGVQCLSSAALVHGWPVKTTPDRPQIAVPRNRNVTDATVDLRRLRLAPDDVDGAVTVRDRTLLDCLRMQSFDEALAVADSALRSGFRKERLVALARDARGSNVLQIRQVAAVADARAANPFESVLRAIALGVAGLAVEPQVSIRREQAFLGQVDLADQRLMIVIEADSFEWHGSRAALHRDTRRYNAMGVAGWLVLRFSWEDVMFHPEIVRATLESAVAERTGLVCPSCRSAA